MSKYDSLKGKLPGFQQEASFQQKVDEVKSGYQLLTASMLAKKFIWERQTKKVLEEEISKLNINMEALSQLLNDYFEASGMTKFSLETGETCYQQLEPYSSVADQGALLEYIKKSKQQALLKLAWGTMNALNKERLMAGKPAMPGTQVFLKTSVRMRGGKDSQED